MWYIIISICFLALSYFMIAMFVAKDAIDIIDYAGDIHTGFVLCCIFVVPLASFLWPFLLFIIIFGILPYFYFKDPEEFKEFFKPKSE